MDAFVATGDMHAAVDVLEAAVAAGVVPESGTIAALIGGCQRTRSFELAFQARTLLRFVMHTCVHAYLQGVLRGDVGAWGTLQRSR